MSKTQKVYTETDLIGMSEADLFGLWAYVKLDFVELPDTDDYAKVFTDYFCIGRKRIINWLVQQKINKP